MLTAGKGTVVLAALLNLGFYGVRAIVAGTMINDRLNGDVVSDENVVTPILVQTTLIVSMIGCASGFAGMLHNKEWSSSSRLVGIGVGVIACMLDLLAFGYASKQWQVGDDDLSESLGGRAQFIGAAAAIQVATQIIYVAVINASDPELVESEPMDTAPGDKEP